jgi:hypothetical protein
VRLRRGSSEVSDLPRFEDVGKDRKCEEGVELEVRGGYWCVKGEGKW